MGSIQMPAMAESARDREQRAILAVALPQLRDLIQQHDSAAGPFSRQRLAETA